MTHKELLNEILIAAERPYELKRQIHYDTPRKCRSYVHNDSRRFNIFAEQLVGTTRMNIRLKCDDNT